MQNRLARIIHEKCLKRHRVSGKMLLSHKKQLLSQDTLWKQSLIISSSLRPLRKSHGQ